MDFLNITLDERPVKARRGATILEVARQEGIYIPTLCYDPDLEPYGACRLCIVEVHGMRGFPAACVTPVQEGMRINTETPQLTRLRRMLLRLLVANHQGECLTCAKNQQCELQKVAAYLGVEMTNIRHHPQEIPADTSNPFFIRDLNKCILCARCVRTCQELVGAAAIDTAFRGYASKITTFGDRPLRDSACESCGECVVHCPVGALAPRQATWASREIKSICPYCGVGCSIYLGVRGNELVSVRGDTASEVNRGQLCVKGRFGIVEFVHHPERLTSPLIKINGHFCNVTWDEALDYVARRLATCRGEAFAAVASAKNTNEDNYVLQKFTRQVMGTNNVDHCARL